MSFEEVERKSVWCIHFWDMELYPGEVLGKEKGKNTYYVRMAGAAINDIQMIDGKNMFYSEESAEKALFKAKLSGKKRKAPKTWVQQL